MAHVWPQAEVASCARCPRGNELARRRYEKLVDLLEGLMRASLKPRHRGYHVQLILSSGDLEEMAN
ncbi:hypothetical protein ABZ611_01240 [Streptomyces sp. NPDC007861]|uniref:hypothetical protein n=1 Tax=Streptomyces sp. NPDC007861 TaxID=3154893 RepID=UPI0033CFA93E